MVEVAKNDDDDGQEGSSGGVKPVLVELPTIGARDAGMSSSPSSSSLSSVCACACSRRAGRGASSRGVPEPEPEAEPPPPIAASANAGACARRRLAGLMVVVEGVRLGDLGGAFKGRQPPLWGAFPQPRWHSRSPFSLRMKGMSPPRVRQAEPIEIAALHERGGEAEMWRDTGWWRLTGVD